MRAVTLEPTWSYDPSAMDEKLGQAMASGSESDALWIYRLKKLKIQGQSIAEAGTNRISFWDFCSPILDFQPWAQRSQYTLSTIAVPEGAKPLGNTERFPDHLRRMYCEYENIYNKPVYMCRATDCYLVKLAWRSQNGGVDEHFRLFSTRLDYLCEEREQPYLKYLLGNTYIKALSPRLNRGLFDFSLFGERASVITEPCIFLGSRQNYGHWFHDFIPKFWILDQFAALRELPILVGKINDFQRESLNLLEKSLDNFVELPEGHEVGCSLYKCKELYVPSEVPYGLANKYIKSKFCSQTQGAKSRRVLLSRAGLGHRSRVGNEEQIVAALSTRYGFEVIHPERMTIAETISVMQEAEVVVTTAGAQTANLMFSEKTPLILLIGSRILRSHDYGISAAIRDFFAFCDDIYPIEGQLRKEASNVFDDVYHYDLSAICRAVEASLDYDVQAC